MPPRHEAWLVAAASTVFKEAKPLLYGRNADPAKMTHSRIALASRGPSFLMPRRCETPSNDTTTNGN